MKKYVITSYIPGSEINEDFFKELKNYAKANKAEIVIPLTKSNSKKEEGCAPSNILPYATIETVKLNNSIHISDIPSNVNVIDPLSGMESLANSKGSFILPTTRHRFKSVARSLKHDSHPRGIWGTGTISKPHYKETKTGYRIQDYHTYGALIVEVIDNKIYYIRQLTYKDSAIYDLDKKYSKGKVTKAKVLAVSLGDVHPPFICPKVLDATVEMLKKYKPKNVVYHDIFDACSISHHTEGKFITKALIHEKSYKCLSEELDYTEEVLSKLVNVNLKANHYIAKSNHDEHLDRYLDEFRFRDDEHNLIDAIDLVKQQILFKLSRHDMGALEDALKVRGLNDKVTFLERKDKLEIAGIELSNHGDYGPNGSRGNAKIHGLSFTGKIVTGHAHTPEIGPYGNYVNGTMTKLSLPYTNDSGTSGWLNTHTFIYENGTMSHFHIIV